jgi:hypothetical protein
LLCAASSRGAVLVNGPAVAGPALRARITKAALDGDFYKVLETCKADEPADAATLASAGAALAAGDREAARFQFAEAA